ncbi:hypothetical protein ABEB36_005104 [Hypothenemus hampei]
MAGYYGGTTCSVLSCWASKASKHRFPNPKFDSERMEKWITLCGDQRLKQVPKEKLYASYRVCSIHFVKSDFKENNRLNRTAVPSLNLPDPLPSEREKANELGDINLSDIESSCNDDSAIKSQEISPERATTIEKENNFSNSEMRDMLCVFAQTSFNGLAAARRYEQLYPMRRQPNYKVYRNLYTRLGETGSFHSSSGSETILID